MRCPSCGGNKFQLRNLRMADWPSLFMLRYPVECYACRFHFRLPMQSLIAGMHPPPLQADAIERAQISEAAASAEPAPAPKMPRQLVLEMERMEPSRPLPPKKAPGSEQRAKQTAPMCRLDFSRHADARRPAG